MKKCEICNVTDRYLDHYDLVEVDGIVYCSSCLKKNALATLFKIVAVLSIFSGVVWSISVNSIIIFLYSLMSALFLFAVAEIIGLLQKISRLPK